MIPSPDGEVITCISFLSPSTSTTLQPKKNTSGFMIAEGVEIRLHKSRPRRLVPSWLRRMVAATRSARGT